MSKKKPLSAREKLFCFYVVETNNRILSIEKSGFCVTTVANAKDRKYTAAEKHTINSQAYKLLQKPSIKEEINILIEQKLMFLKEQGISTQFEVLKWISDVMTGKYDTINAFLLQQRISAAKELMVYYKEQTKLGKKANSNEDPENIKEAKKFIVEYVPKVMEDD